MNFVKLFSLLPADLCIFHSHNAKARIVNHLKDIANMPVANSIGFDHCKSAISHNVYFSGRKSKSILSLDIPNF
jgi:hypothetical protein